MYFNQCSQRVIFHGGNLPDFFFLSGICEHLLRFSAPMMTWSWREWFGKSMLHGYIYLYYDRWLFIVCVNGSRKLQTSSVLLQNQMFPTLRFLNFIDRSDTLAHVFFRLIFGRTLALFLRPLASVVSFLGHEGTTFSLKFICSFLRFSFTTYGSTMYIVRAEFFVLPFRWHSLTNGRCFVFGSIF